MGKWSRFRTRNRLQTGTQQLQTISVLVFTKVNFTLKPSAQLSLLMSTAVSQTDKVVSIVNSTAVAQEVWKQMLNQKQGNKLWENIIHEH